MEDIPCKKIPLLNGRFALSPEGSMPKMKDKSFANILNFPVQRKIEKQNHDVLELLWLVLLLLQ